MIRFLAPCALLLATACVGDESVAKYGAADKVWTLTEIDGTAFATRATLEFGKDGQVSGQAPCNRYSAKQSAPYPWFKLGPVLSTKMACAALESERTFFSALEAMTLSEVSQNTLILSNDQGRAMVFKSE
ncbi:MAG: META domain-containing protein [Planktotalea sp.]|uniref:META domain-containing protein n=1 Tax=Planktotalea sp. TaxID=2029877 RepID=UPI003C76BACD